MEYYTYIHIKDNQPIYVGKGKNNRAYTKRDYDNYNVKIIDKNLSEETALELEEFLIQEIGINNLYNIRHKGNVGPNAINIDYRWKPFQEHKLRIAKQGAKEICRFAEQIIDDACNGNIKAIKIALKVIPKETITNYLLENSHLFRGVSYG
jgi:hypothetical protein